MSKWPMRGQFRHLHFKTFPMTPRKPQCEVFWPFNSSSEFSEVPEDSKFPLLGVWASPSHLAQSGVATHINFQSFHELAKSSLILGLSCLLHVNFTCEIYKLGKQAHYKKIPRSTSTTMKHSHVCNPFKHPIHIS
jgi:hypothetical protein